MAHKKADKSSLSPLQNFLFSPNPSMTSYQSRSPLRIPLSATYDNTLRVPSCANHKRRKGTYIINLQEGEVLYLCSKCMEMAEISGFKGSMIEEFHRIFPKQSFTKVTEEQHKKVRTKQINSYLQKLKDCYEKAGNFSKKIISQQEDLNNSNFNIYQLFQRFEKQIQKLKLEFLEEFSMQKSVIDKHYQQITCKVDWINSDLQDMISRVCKNYDKLSKENTDSFKINMQLMTETLREKEIGIEKLEDKFISRSKENSTSLAYLNDEYAHKLHQIWKELMLDRSISKISISKLSGQDISPQFCKILQDLSTSHTLV